MYKCHVFICTNQASEKTQFCGQKDSQKLHADLKKMCREQPWGKQVRINKSGCLGFCEKGISTVIYPQNIWHFHQTKDSAGELFKKIETLMLEGQSSEQETRK